MTYWGLWRAISSFLSHRALIVGCQTWCRSYEICIESKQQNFGYMKGIPIYIRFLPLGSNLAFKMCRHLGFYLLEFCNKFGIWRERFSLLSSLPSMHTEHLNKLMLLVWACTHPSGVKFSKSWQSECGAHSMATQDNWH
jgi:hypothetical protein